MQVHYIVCMHGAQCMRHVGIISGVFSFLLYIDKEKRSSCFYFITTRSTCWDPDMELWWTHCNTPISISIPALYSAKPTKKV